MTAPDLGNGGERNQMPIGVRPQADTARSFRSRAENTTYAHDARIYFWLSAICADPTDGSQWSSYLSYLSESKVPPKDLKKGLSTFEPGSLPLALRPLAQGLRAVTERVDSYSELSELLEQVSLLRLTEPVKVIATRLLSLLQKSRDRGSERRSPYQKLISIAAKEGLSEIARDGAEALAALFPHDATIVALNRDMAAAHAISVQGLDQPIGEGHFRRNIRDRERQEELQRDERVVRGDQELSDAVSTAEARYAADPHSSHNIGALVKLLKLRGDTRSLGRAVEVLRAAYQGTGGTMYRRQAVELEISLLTKTGETDPRAAEQILELRLNEWKVRINEEPRNTGVRLDYARILLERGQPAAALETLANVTDSTLEVEIGAARLRGFASLGWWREFVVSLRIGLDEIAKTRARVPAEWIVEIIRAFVPSPQSDRQEAGRAAIAECLARDPGIDELRELREKLG